MSVNSKQAWSERRATAQRVRAVLVERFPGAFKGPGEPKPPLMLGISAEIMLRCPDLSKHDLDCAMWDYTSGSTYLRSFVEGAQRLDLDGNPVAILESGAIGNAEMRLRAYRATAERTAEKRQATLAHATIRRVKEERAADEATDESTPTA